MTMTVTVTMTVTMTMSGDEKKTPLYHFINPLNINIKYIQSKNKTKETYNMTWLKCFVATIHATCLSMFDCIAASICSPSYTVSWLYVFVVIIIAYKRSPNNSFQLIPGQRVVMNNLFSCLMFFVLKIQFQQLNCWSTAKTKRTSSIHHTCIHMYVHTTPSWNWNLMPILFNKILYFFLLLLLLLFFFLFVFQFIILKVDFEASVYFLFT